MGNGEKIDGERRLMGRDVILSFGDLETAKIWCGVVTRKGGLAV